MQQALSVGWGEHIAGIAAATFLHLGIAAIALKTNSAPELHTSAPKPQVIEVTMVTIAKPEPQKTITSAIAPKPVIHKTPAKPKGMLKQKEKTVPEISLVEKTAIPATAKNHVTTQTHEIETASVVNPPVAAAYLNNPPPPYPARARRLKQEGEVMLNVQVSSEGKPQSVHIVCSSGYALLDESAAKTVHGWQFIPASRGEEKISASVLIPVRFQIN